MPATAYMRDTANAAELIKFETSMVTNANVQVATGDGHSMFVTEDGSPGACMRSQ